MNSLKRVLNCLRFNEEGRKIVKNDIFQVPFDEHKTTVIQIPNIQNKTFTVSKWFVKVGDYIEKNQLICELESNSITLEFESLHAGKLVLITSSKEKLKAGDLICKVEKV